MMHKRQKKKPAIDTNKPAQEGIINLNKNKATSEGIYSTILILQDLGSHPKVNKSE